MDRAVLAGKKTIAAAYKRLLGAFGPQGWWPVSQGRNRHPRYRPLYYGPHSEAAMFEICAGAILTQNTAWNNALAALAALRGAGKLGAAEIGGTDLKTLGALIRSSGFYRQKAVRLKAFALHILRRHPDGLKNWFNSASAEELRTELLGLNGIGPETADSMALYAGGKPKFVVDAYAVRILGRLGLPAGTYAETQAAFERALPGDHRVYNEYHALMVALAKTYCRKTVPCCSKCPLRNACKHAKKKRS